MPQWLTQQQCPLWGNTTSAWQLCLSGIHTAHRGVKKPQRSSLADIAVCHDRTAFSQSHMFCCVQLPRTPAVIPTGGSAIAMHTLNTPLLARRSLQLHLLLHTQHEWIHACWTSPHCQFCHAVSCTGLRRSLAAHTPLQTSSPRASLQKGPMQPSPRKHTTALHASAPKLGPTTAVMQVLAGSMYAGPLVDGRQGHLFEGVTKRGMTVRLTGSRV